MIDDHLSRFLFDQLDVRGAIVRLGPAWQSMLDNRHYPAPVARLLGEMTATTLLLADHLKQPGRLTIQLRGNGAVPLLVVDCNERLQIRGMAKSGTLPTNTAIAELLGDGQLLLAVDMASMREPYQSIVPRAGESIAEVFENYLRQSDQLPARFFLATSSDAVAGLFLQKLPTSEQGDPDGWARVEALAATVTPAELLTVPTQELLLRLFPEETLRLFTARTLTHNCPEDWEKVRSLLRALGPAEVYAVLRENGEVLIKDDICNRAYRFDARAIDDLFRDSPATTPTVH